jgi:hypothetical protein
LGRTIGAVAAGVVLWGGLWNGGNASLAAAGLFVMGESVTSVPVLLVLVAYSAALSVLAGYVVAMIRGGDAMGAVQALAGVNLTIGIVVEVIYWGLMPAWYHMAFLALVVPMTLAGGRMRMRRRTEATEA